MTRRAFVAFAVCLAAVVPSLDAQTRTSEARTFNLYVENDAFVESDTGYTNGLRASWTLNRFYPWMPRATMAGPQALFGKLGWLGLGPDTAHGRFGCSPADIRDDRVRGRCYMMLLALGQTMYTPDSLLDRALEPDDRPYAGFFFVSIGTGFIDSPQARHSNSLFVLTQMSNELVLGVTGPGAIARETQSLAHWTWSHGATHPEGWHNQLRGGVQWAVLSRLATRTKGMELCLKKFLGERTCTGGIDEWRVLDVTPRFETVFGSYMRRATGGFVLRIGERFPDFLNADRIPTTAPGSARSGGDGESCWCAILRRVFPEWPWAYVFGSADARYVEHNAFIQGGSRDDGPLGWKTLGNIDKREGLAELGFGAAIGTSHMSLSLQITHRSPEYDVVGADRFRGFARYGTLNLTINSVAQARANP